MPAPSPELLRAFGVPEHVAKYLHTRYFPERWERLASAHAVLVALWIGLAPFASAAVGIALLSALETPQLVFRSDVGLAGILVISISYVASVFAAGALADASLGLLPDRLRLFLRWRSIHLHPVPPPVLLRWAAARVRDVRPEAFLDAQARVVRRACWVIATVLAVALCASWAYVRARHTEVRVTAHGIEEHDTLAPWEDVEAVELGCAHVCRRDVVRYDLRLADGRRLEGLRGCPTAEQLSALEEVDALVRQHDVPRRRATHADGQQFWDSGCVERVAAATGVNASTLARTLALE